MASITVRITTRTPQQVCEPIMYRLVQKFLITPNILRAEVNEEKGFLELELSGELEEVQRTIAWLNTTGLYIDAIQRSFGKDTVNL